MFRALSIRRDRKGYEQLGGDGATSSSALMPKLNRAESMPANVVNSPKRTTATKEVKEAKKASKVHPFFSLLETKKRKKVTTKPEFSRYLEYLREGGAWDMTANKPVMYYK